MRKRSENTEISVHAIAGTEVVLLGLNATDEAAEGLLGFSIFKRTGKRGKEYALGGGKNFPGARRNARSDEAPLQSFMWSDYVVEPNTEYTYRVVPVYGEPGALETGDSVKVTIKTEDPWNAKGKHGVFFNRGVAGSQAYSRHFRKYRKYYKVRAGFRDELVWRAYLKPEDVPARKAYEWLSRGLEEAILRFIGQAKGPKYAIRAAIYELTHAPVIQAFVDALETGADVKIVHHAKQQTSYEVRTNRGAVCTVEYDDDATDGPSPPPPAEVVFNNKELRKEKTNDGVARAASRAVVEIGLSNLGVPEVGGKLRREAGSNAQAYDEMMIPRTNTTISHNKFIVLLKDGNPIQVWTGSTNLTAGGIFGQSNVGHTVRDEEVAQAYLDYWEKLRTDPVKRKSSPEDIRNWTVEYQADLTGAPPPNSITPMFSPRNSAAMLQWYADRLAAAKSSVHFTAAFTVANEIFEKVIKNKRTGDPYLRYLLLEGITGLMKPKYPRMAQCRQNRIAWGDTLKTRSGEDEEDQHHQFIETLTGLNDHVNYLHTKYMLIDPLSDDPVVVTGSANFSTASTINNDENMLIIRGDTRVADIFLGEFMRLFNHFEVRNKTNAMNDEEAAESQDLLPDDSWTDSYYTEGSQDQQERLLFK